MVLPEKLVGLGLSLGTLLSPTDAGAVSPKVLRLRDLGDIAGSSTTDLVRFSGTLKVARGIVEEQKRAEMIEVPASGLVSILDRIQALENEVQDMLDGTWVSKNGKSIDPSAAAGSASGGSATSLPGSSSSAGPSSDGSSSGAGGSSGNNPSGESSGSSGSGSSGSGSNDSGGSSPSGSSGSSPKATPSGSTPPGSSPSATTSASGSPSGSSTSGQDDCAPEHLLYRLGGASLERRALSVSAHPLFRRNPNCTLDSVSGSGGKALPSGVAVFKEDTSSATAGSSSDGAPAGESGAANPTAAGKFSAPESQSATPSAVSAGKGAVTSGALRVTALPSAATAGLGSKVEGDDPSDTPSAASAGKGAVTSGALRVTALPSAITSGWWSKVKTDSPSESDGETTITTTMTSTSFTTVTVRLGPSPTKPGFNGKFLNNTALISTAHLSTTVGFLLPGTTSTAETETASLMTALPEKGDLAQKDETVSASSLYFPKSVSSAFVLQEQPAASASSSGSPFTGRSSATTRKFNSSSTSQPTTIAPTASGISTSHAGTITVLPSNQKNATLPSAVSETTNSTNSILSSETSRETLVEKNSTATPSALLSESATPVSINALGTSSLQSVSGLASTNSSAIAVEKAAVSGSALTTTSTTTSTKTSTVSIIISAGTAARPANGTISSGGTGTAPAATASGLVSTNSSAVAVAKAALTTSTTTSTMTSTVSVILAAGTAARSTNGTISSGGTGTAPAATASALASDGTLKRRQSGFKTVRTTRQRTAAVDKQ